jgi:hypothetical protein
MDKPTDERCDKCGLYLLGGIHTCASHTMKPAKEAVGVKRNLLEEVDEWNGSWHSRDCALNLEDGSYDGCDCGVKDEVRKLIDQAITSTQEDMYNDLHSLAMTFELNILIDEHEQESEWYGNLQEKMRNALKEKLAKYSKK